MADHSNAVEHPLFLADNLALDFINSAYGEGVEKRDFFDSDAGVVTWLKQAGSPPTPQSSVPTAGLLQVAVEFRTAARVLVEKRMADRWADPSPLNGVLALGRRYTQVHWSRSKPPELVTVQVHDETASLLLPVAEALATLLVEADFTRVRQCAGDACTLLFHDRTRTHRRRWCDMAVCGNRAKISSFRSRQRGEIADGAK